jgi:PleD family two-component response regulator
MKNNQQAYIHDILIVDDTPENLTVLRQMLAEQNYMVRPALNGEIAINAVNMSSPDLILLDIRMPGMDGYEVCKQLKSEEKTRRIPVIFISALNELDDKIKAFSLGGVDYITKPFQAEEVLARVKTHLTLRSLQKSIEDKNAQLQKALDEIKTLQGIIPICANCKNVRDDKGFWNQVETYISKHSEAEFSHSICPPCAKELYPDLNIHK